MWETLKVATFAIPQSHSVDCKAERVRPGRCGNDTPIVPSASWRRSKTVTRNGRRTSPRRRGTSRLTAGTSGVRCAIENPRWYLQTLPVRCEAAHPGTMTCSNRLPLMVVDALRTGLHAAAPMRPANSHVKSPCAHGAKYSKRNYTGERLRSGPSSSRHKRRRSGASWTN